MWEHIPKMGSSGNNIIFIAGLLVLFLSYGKCQGNGRDFFYPPVDHGFGPPQSSLYSNSRLYYGAAPSDNFRQEFTAPQLIFDGQSASSFPSPNYNQNPSPFQLPTGRSQPPGQYYLNQAEYISPQRFENRPESPPNIQFPHPASTNRPDLSHFVHSSMYQHDPSKPETFLGQITLNNPETDFLPPNRDLRSFKSQQFNTNSLKNQQDMVDPDIDNDSDVVAPEEDIFGNHRVTTYNPNKVNQRTKSFKEKLQISARRPSLTDDLFTSNENSFSDTRNRFNPSKTSTTTTRPKGRPQFTTKSPVRYHPQTLKSNKVSISPRKSPSTTTEYKPLVDLEPLLEDDISDKKTFTEYLKHNQNGSIDVKVINTGDIEASRPNYQGVYDNNPSASSLNGETESGSNKSTNPNMVENADLHQLEELSVTTIETKMDDDNENGHFTTEIPSIEDDIPEKTAASPMNEPENKDLKVIKEKDKVIIDDDDYDDEFYDEEESTTFAENNPMVRHEYTTEFIDYEEEEVTTKYGISAKDEEAMEVVTLEPNHSKMNENNSKTFVNDDKMDNTNSTDVSNSESTEIISQLVAYEESTTDIPSIIGKEVVSVVTTKSVVNGTFSIPDVTPVPMITRDMKSSTPIPPSTLNTTESWVVVASVQTSRSVSGARFLPFPTVEQDEKKQVLTDEDEDLSDTDEDINLMAPNQTLNSTTPLENQYNKSEDIDYSTERIIDQLDQVKSELSSNFSSASFDNSKKKFAISTEVRPEKETTTTPSPNLKLFTLKSTPVLSTTEKFSLQPLPVTIKKFAAYTRSMSTTTPRPKKIPNFEVIKMDDLAGLLPTGFKPRPSFKDRKKTVNSPTTATTAKPISNEKELNSTQGRSSGISFKNQVTIQDDISSLLPKGFKPQGDRKPMGDLLNNIKSDETGKLLPADFDANASSEKPTLKSGISSLFEKAEPIDISALLPKGYKPPVESSSAKPKLNDSPIDHAKEVDISALLPPGFKLDEEKDSIKTIKIADISKLLPPGFKPTAEKNDEKTVPNKPQIKQDLSTLLPPGFKLDADKDSLKPIKIADVSSLLPPGFNPSPKDNKTISSEEQGAKSNSGFKPVFPSRPGNKPIRKMTTPKPAHSGNGPASLMPAIQKGWPVRASTEFTGWPTPSTTPFSIDKLLEAQRNATATTEGSDAVTTSTTRRTTTTTSTTTPAPAPTTPGVCREDCDIAATIKIIGGVNWVPELLDHNTKEWQNLAREVAEELNSVYTKSDVLRKWYKGVRIDAFSKGSVLVDYFVELNKVSQRVDTLELKKLFHKSLNDAKPGSVMMEAPREMKEMSFDPDIMVGDQPEEDRVNVKETVKMIDNSKGKLEVGKFIVDPMYTEFIVLPARPEPTPGVAEADALLPQWGIAVIVIALASLLFVVIFGVTVLINRQKNSKAKQPIPLSEDMLRELDKSHMGGDELYLKERELPHLPRSKRMSSSMLEQLGHGGGDSWRSEWTPALQQYLAQQQQQQYQYAPDSGRGSQIYGAHGGSHNYGYSGSQVYGHGGGGGSHLYGYTGSGAGEGDRGRFARRRSDYDPDF